VNGVATADLLVPPKTFGTFNMTADYVDPDQPANDSTDHEVIFLTPPPIHLVTNLATSGEGTLFDQIQKANSLQQSELITFADGLSGTVTMNSPLILNKVSIAAPKLGSITIVGDFTVAATGSLRLFSLVIAGGPGLSLLKNSGNAELRDCTLTGSK